MARESKLPATVYIAIHHRQDNAQTPYLAVEADARDLMEFIGDEERVGVYQLVGHIDVQNRTIASEVQPLKARGK